ncbi:MAG: PEGA domain-containing protein [Kiritimatiellae bacterium]|nr:PEGA domain-containing protein [Kiritimatiellia bacterium]MDD5520406.1 PEGA domain-containing protein [Kiritimatiellia bacterium]
MRFGKYILNVVIMSFAVAVVMASDDQEKGCQIRVVTDPPEAVVYCDGIMKDPAPIIISDLKAGDHLVTAVKQGYKEVRRSISLLEGQKTAVELKLEPIVGLVLVYSSPSGSDVQIDGADRGKTPLLIHNLPLGKYRLKVSSQGYAPKEVDLVIKDRTPMKMDINLFSDSAMLELSSQPQGADVTLNGIAKGKTPCVIDRIPAGNCQLEMVLDGYAPYKQVLSLQAGQREKMTAVLKVIPSELTVVTIPAKARVYVENQFRGESPVTLPNLTPGEYRIRAELIGCEPLARTVKLEKNQKLVEEFRLMRDCGILELTTEPAGVKVLVDGKDSGVTVAKANETDRVSEPLTIDFLSAGPHQVQLVKKGYFDASVEVTIEKEKTAVRHQQMKQRFIPDCEVRTITDEVFKGVLTDVDAQGNVKLEIRPGIFKSIPAKDVKMRLPLRAEKTATQGQ